MLGCMHVFPLEIKRWRTLMQPPLACHANLEAKRGGAAVSSEQGETWERVRVWNGVGEANESIMCIEVQQWTTPNHVPRLILRCMPRIIISSEVCLYASVSARNMNSWVSVCVTVRVCGTPFCPLWLSLKDKGKEMSLRYVKHANLIELMTRVQASTVLEDFLFLFS